MAYRFHDRRDAGRQLAGHLMHLAGRSDTLVLGLPRGGVPVAYEIAMALAAPLDVFLVRKIGVPGHEELAMGAIASGGVVVLNEPTIRSVGIAPQTFERVAEREALELERREHLYRADLPARDVRGRTVVVVDDGMATGSSLRAAVTALRQLAPGRIVVAVPVAPRESCEALAGLADEVVCAVTPDPFFSVGSWYADFAQTSDEEVRHLLELAPQTGRTHVAHG